MRQEKDVKVNEPALSGIILPGERTAAALKKQFSDYVKTFLTDDLEYHRNINIKIEHTERVVKESVALAAALGLSEEERNLAGVIALFHDIGRFEQFRRYRTFSDRKSEDHAKLGLDVLTREGFLDSLDAETRALIRWAIGNHNRPFLPATGTAEGLFFSRLLRDADKLDIWKVVTDYYHRKDAVRNPALELELPDAPGVSAAVTRAIRAGHNVDINDVRNLNDFKLLQAGWIFDIHFEPTICLIRERRYLEKIRAVLPESKTIDALFSIMRGRLRPSDRPKIRA